MSVLKTELAKDARTQPAAIGTPMVASLVGAIFWSAFFASLQWGRTTPGTVSLRWALAFAAVVVGVLLPVGLTWIGLRLKCRVGLSAAGVRVGASCVPLYFVAPLLLAIYQSDGLFHYFVTNPIPRALAAWIPLAAMFLLLEANLFFSVRLPAAFESWLRQTRSTPLLLFVAFFVLYTFTSGGHLYSPDEREMYQVTETMAEGSMPLTHEDAAATDGNGRLYSKYGLVTSLLALPPYLIARTLSLDPDPPSAAFPIPNGSYPLVDLLVSPIVSALTVALLYALARAISFEKTTSILTALIYGLATSSWVYSKTFFSQPSATLFLTGATFFALRRSKNPVRDFALSGALLGLAAGSRVEVLFIALPLLFACLVRALRSERGTGVKMVIAFIVGLGVFAGITAGWYDYMKTGSVLSTGHGRQETLAGFSAKPYIGLFGSLFSSGFGLVTFNPVVALGAVAFPMLAVKRGFEARVFGAMIAIAILLYGSFGDWSGGFTWANRYLVVILPFAVLPVGMFFERPWRSVIGVAFVAGTALLGLAINLLAVLFDFNNGWLDLWDHRASLFQIQWDAHFSPIGAHVRLLGNFLATGAKLDLYLLYKLGLPVLIVVGILLSFLAAMAFRSAVVEPAGEFDSTSNRA